MSSSSSYFFGHKCGITALKTMRLPRQCLSVLWQDEEEDCISQPVDLPYTEHALKVPNVSIDGRYYEGGVSSVYFWDLDDGFAGVVLLKKSMRASTTCILFRTLSMLILFTATPKGKNEGAWDSIHVFEAIDRARTAHYKLTSTVILQLGTKTEALGDMDLSGNMTRQIEQDMPVNDDASHIVNVGRLVEDMELKMRNLLRKLSSSMDEVKEQGTWGKLIRRRGSVLRQSEGRRGRSKKYVASRSRYFSMLLIEYV